MPPVILTSKLYFNNYITFEINTLSKKLQYFFGVQMHCSPTGISNPLTIQDICEQVVPLGCRHAGKDVDQDDIVSPVFFCEK